MFEDGVYILILHLNKEKKYDLGDGNIIRRSRLDWIDQHIQNNIQHLAFVHRIPDT